jgi:hypothetical protein
MLVLLQYSFIFSLIFDIRDRVAEFRAQALEDGVAASKTALLAHQKEKIRQ